MGYGAGKRSVPNFWDWLLWNATYERANQRNLARPVFRRHDLHPIFSRSNCEWTISYRFKICRNYMYIFIIFKICYFAWVWTTSCSHSWALLFSFLSMFSFNIHLNIKFHFDDLFQSYFFISYKLGHGTNLLAPTKFCIFYISIFFVSILFLRRIWFSIFLSYFFYYSLAILFGSKYGGGEFLTSWGIFFFIVVLFSFFL